MVEVGGQGGRFALRQYREVYGIQAAATADTSVRPEIPVLVMAAPVILVDLSTRIPTIVAAIDDADGPADVIDMLLLGPFVAGLQPVSRTIRLERVSADAPLVPRGITPTRVVVEDGWRTLLAEGPGWTLRSVRWRDAWARLTVVAETDELAAAVLADAVAGACEPLGDDGLTIPVSFWYRTGNGQGRRVGRDISAADWPTIRDNYPAAASRALERLMAVGPDAANGRLLLLHGPSGTGKTTAIRAIAAAWRHWCHTEVVVDSDRLYDDAAYLMAVLMAEPDEDGEAPQAGRWRLLVLEDCDELIRADAKQQAGQALGRLLNVTDGLVGQGLKLLVAMTTNEPLGTLHPAIVRPGRCLAEVHVGPFSRAEAIAWLGSAGGVPATGATLAELYALRGTVNPVRATELKSVAGLYL